MNKHPLRVVAIAMMAAFSTPSQAAALKAGETLWQGSFLYSDDLHYFAAMQSDGNLVVYRNNGTNSAVWSTNTAGLGANRAVMQSDGNLVLYTPDHRAVWQTGSHGQGHFFTVTEHGQAMVLAIVPTWNSDSGMSGVSNDMPMIFGNGTALNKGQNYTHANGHTLIFQTDGNLVLYRHGVAIWASHTWRASSAHIDNGLHVTGGKKRNFHAGSLPAPKYGPSTSLIRSLGFLALASNGNLTTYGVREIWTASEYDRRPAKHPGHPPCAAPTWCIPSSFDIWRLRF